MTVGMYWNLSEIAFAIPCDQDRRLLWSNYGYMGLQILN